MYLDMYWWQLSVCWEDLLRLERKLMMSKALMLLHLSHALLKPSLLSLPGNFDSWRLRHALTDTTYMIVNQHSFTKSSNWFNRVTANRSCLGVGSVSRKAISRKVVWLRIANTICWYSEIFARPCLEETWDLFSLTMVSGCTLGFLANANHCY